jgi:SAM-dependent methyltransferase
MTDSPDPGSGHAFDQGYWDRHYRGPEERHPSGPPNPHLVRETIALTPSTALDAGCGEGAEALWLADRGWDVTAADIASEALSRARSRAAGAHAGRVRWEEVDLGSWEPEQQFDLVTTHYAHPAMPQLDFYDRIAGWVAPGGTLLVVGHLHEGSGHDPGRDEAHPGEPPAKATVTAADVVNRLDRTGWEVLTAEARSRTVSRGGAERTLHDVVVRARRA